MPSIAGGRGGELLGYVVGLTAWGYGQSTQVMVQNWPLLLVGGSVIAIIWVMRQF